MTQAKKDLLEALEALAHGHPLPLGRDFWDLLDLARVALADPPAEQVEAGIEYATRRESER